MSKRKEYNDRWHAPLVNPAFTESDYQLQKDIDLLASLGLKPDINAGHFEEIKARSEAVTNEAD